MIRLVAFDVDGTLLTSDHQVSDTIVQAVDACAERGIAIAFCTGRSRREMDDIRSRLRNIRYAVTASGGSVMDLSEDREIASSLLEMEAVRSIHSRAASADCLFELYADGRVFAPIEILHDFMKRVESHHRRHLEMTVTPLHSFESYLRGRRRGVEKINMLFMDRAARDAAGARVQGEAAEICAQEDRALECTRPGTDKGSGLAALAAHLGVGWDEILAVGDNYNDLPLRRAAGQLAAMGNACDELKACADLVIPSNDEDGAAYVLNRLILHPQR